MPMHTFPSVKIITDIPMLSPLHFTIQKPIKETKLSRTQTKAG